MSPGNRITISAPVPISKIAQLLKLTLVLFVRRGRNESTLTCYSRFVYRYLSENVSTAKFEITFPSGSEISDRSTFYTEEEPNRIYSEATYFNVIRQTLEHRDKEILDGVSPELRNFCQQHAGRSDIAIVGKTPYYENDHVMIIGKSKSFKDNSTASLDHGLPSLSIPDTLQEFFTVGHWVKGVWQYTEPYPDEVNLAVEISFAPDGELVALNSLSTYLVVGEGYDLKHSESRLLTGESSNSRDVEIKFDRRYDHQGPDRKFFSEWEELGIRDSPQYRIHETKPFRSALSEGISGMRIAVTLSDERLRQFKALRFGVVAIILSLLAEFVPPVDGMLVLGAREIPAPIIDVLYFLLLLLAGWGWVYWFRPPQTAKVRLVKLATYTSATLVLLRYILGEAVARCCAAAFRGYGEETLTLFVLASLCVASWYFVLPSLRQRRAGGGNG